MSKPIALTLSPMGGSLRPPPLAEIRIVPKRMPTPIWNFLTFYKHKKLKIWGNLNFNFLLNILTDGQQNKVISSFHVIFSNIIQ